MINLIVIITTIVTIISVITTIVVIIIVIILILIRSKQCQHDLSPGRQVAQTQLGVFNLFKKV